MHQTQAWNDLTLGKSAFAPASWQTQHPWIIGLVYRTRCGHYGEGCLVYQNARASESLCACKECIFCACKRAPRHTENSTNKTAGETQKDNGPLDKAWGTGAGASACFTKQKGDKTDTMTNKKGDKTGHKGRQKGDKVDTRRETRRTQ